MLIFRAEEHQKAWKEAGEFAKTVGLYEPAAGKDPAMSWADMEKYLNQYGCWKTAESGERVIIDDEEQVIRVVARPSPKFDLGEHGFYLQFQWKRGEGWVTEMDGGAVYRPGDGWSIHT